MKQETIATAIWVLEEKLLVYKTQRQKATVMIEILDDSIAEIQYAIDDLKNNQLTYENWIDAMYPKK